VACKLYIGLGRSYEIPFFTLFLYIGIVAIFMTIIAGKMCILYAGKNDSLFSLVLQQQ
jgi:hypothetical protein